MAYSKKPRWLSKKYGGALWFKRRVSMWKGSFASKKSRGSEF